MRKAPSKTSRPGFAVLLGLLATLLVAALHWAEVDRWLEMGSLDARFRWLATAPVSDEIVNVDIDDRSLEELGRWPWPREQLAGVIDVLTECGAKAVALDIILPNPQETRYVSSGGDVYDPAGRVMGTARPVARFDDMILAEAIRQHRERVFLPMFIAPETVGSEKLTPLELAVERRVALQSDLSLAEARAQMARETQGDANGEDQAFRRAYLRARAMHVLRSLGMEANAVWGYPLWSGMVVPPTVLFAAEIRHTGFVTVDPDPDGVVRRIPMLALGAGRVFPQFALAVAAEELGRDHGGLRTFEAGKGVVGVLCGDGFRRDIPVDANGTLLINWMPVREGGSSGVRLPAGYAGEIQAMDARIRRAQDVRRQCYVSLLKLKPNILEFRTEELQELCYKIVSEVDRDDQVYLASVQRMSQRERDILYDPLGTPPDLGDLEAEGKKLEGMIEGDGAKLLSELRNPEYRDVFLGRPPAGGPAAGASSAPATAPATSSVPTSMSSAASSRGEGVSPLRAEGIVPSQVVVSSSSSSSSPSASSSSSSSSGETTTARPLAVPASGPAAEWQRYQAARAEALEVLAVFDSQGKIIEALRAQRKQRVASLSERVGGKICLIGSTATGAADFVPTPMDKRTPGVSVHTNIVNTILSGRFVRPAHWAVNLLAILLAGVSVSLVTARRPVWQSAPVSALLAAGYAAGAAMVVFRLWDVWLAMVAPLAAMFLAFLVVTAYRQLTEERAKRHIRGLFAHALSPELVDRLTEDPSLLNLGGERRPLSCFFSDLRGFTPRSEKLGEQKTGRLLNRYFDRVAGIVQNRQGGYVNKLMGDGMFAFFGAPVFQNDHAARALRAAVDYVAEVDALNPQLAQEFGEPVELFCRIGIATGEVMVGNYGSSDKFDYTAIGQTVNLASRLEGANKFFGTHVLVDENTWTGAAAGDVVARGLGKVLVVGTTEPVAVWNPLGWRKDLSPDAIRAADGFTQAMGLYAGRQFAAAAELLEKYLAVVPDDPAAKVYLDLCRRHAAAPPGPDWDATVKLTEK